MKSNQFQEPCRNPLRGFVRLLAMPATLTVMLVGNVAAQEPVQSTPMPGWSPGKPRFEFWAHRDEKPVLTITASNVAQHADKLSPGQVALFKANPTYQMQVYPTHRECSFPDWYQQNTKANKGRAKLDSTGNYLVDAVLPGRVFDEPKSGAEAMWNWQTHYQGVGYIYQWRTYVSPAPGGTEPIISENVGSQFLPWGKRGETTPAQINDLQSGNWFKVLTPPALAGQGGALRNFFTKNGESYYYFPGQRRVRRMPSYSYDAPQVGFENQYAVDEVYLFYGSIDRFSWKITGKRQMYVPYNAFRMYRSQDDLEKAVTTGGINPEYRRYELHDVVVVEGTLKSDVRHIASKKTIYLDPDTWNILAGEDLDGQGKLSRYREGYTIPVWELAGACTALPTYQYNFTSGRFVADNLLFAQKKEAQFFEAAGGQQEFTDGFYTSQGLQSVSER